MEEQYGHRIRSGESLDDSVFYHFWLDFNYWLWNTKQISADKMSRRNELALKEHMPNLYYHIKMQEFE